MSLYRENQNGIWIIVVLLLAACIPLFGIFNGETNSDKPTVAMVIVYCTLFAVAVLFYRLVTEVHSDRIRVFFGGGLIKKQIPLSRIKEVKVVRNKWFYGWGIRFILNGWLWNIWGLDAVEITFKDKNAIFRIGSQEPQKLKEAIERHLK